MAHVIGSCEVTSLRFAIDILISIPIGIASANQGSEGAPYVIVGETGFGQRKQIRELTLPPRSLEVQRLVLLFRVRTAALRIHCVEPPIILRLAIFITLSSILYEAPATGFTVLISLPSGRITR